MRKTKSMTECRYLKRHIRTEKCECLYYDCALTPIEAMRCYQPGDWSPDCWQEDDGKAHPDLEPLHPLDRLLEYELHELRCPTDILKKREEHNDV